MDKAEYLDKYEAAARAYIDILEHEGPAKEAMAARRRLDMMTSPWHILELIAAKRELDALKAKKS
jgi:hypothetical protein